MNLQDATLIFLGEAAAYPAVASIAQTAYDQIVDSGDVDYRLLSELVDAASGKGVLREIHSKYSPTAYEAIITPILQEIGRRKPIPPRRRPTVPPGSEADPLTAQFWPPPEAR